MSAPTISHYELLDKLGEGGMGTVYKARDPRLDRLLAIKLLPPGFVSDPGRRERFVQEAKAASALNHPNIVCIYDIEAEGDEPFIAMEYVDGKPLDRMIRKKALGPVEAVGIGVQVADALAAAHSAGILHRDIKPANIVVTPQGRAKVLDFGLAKLLDHEKPGEDDTTQAVEPHTAEGTVLGTAAYMSPEQAQGKPLDGRSDIFSFGAVLYEMVTGRRAFAGDNAVSTLAAVLNSDPRRPSELSPQVSRELERIIVQCLRKDPSRRFQHMDDLRVALQEVKEELQSGGIPATPPPSRRPWTLPVLAAGAAVLAGAGFLLWNNFGSRSSKPMVAVPVTAYPGYERRPSFSPDGRQIAFSWTGAKQDNEDIYVVLTSGGPPLRLTTNPAADTAPAWSPDGQNIAFIRNPGPAGALYVVPPIGGPERKIADTKGQSVCWTADGSSLGMMNGNSGISSIAIATGEERKLTSPSRGETDDDCAFSGDGKYLAFVRSSAPTVGRIYLAFANGEGPREILAQASLISGLAWVPGTAELVASLNDPSWEPELVRISVSRLSKPQMRRLALSADWPSLVRPSATAPVRLAYQRTPSDNNLYGVSAQLPPGSAGNAASPLTPIAPSTRNEEDPDFSPDGSRLAFGSARSGKLEIWLSDRDGSNPQQLTRGDCIAGSPRWSPGGDRVAYDCWLRGNLDIYTISTTGGAPLRVTNHPSDDVVPTWSRDGRWIYFSSNRSGRYEIWKAPATGGPAVQFTKAGGYEALETPDGAMVYYTKQSGPGLWSVPVAGGAETLLVNSVRYFWWAMADTGVYFFRCEEARSRRSLVPLDFYAFQTRKVTQVAAVEGQLELATRSLAVTRDGHRLVLVKIDQAGSDIEMIEDFR